MYDKNTRVDEYILNAKPFAQPVLEHLRNIIHEQCSQVRETIKWGMPHFEYNGKNLCSFAAFKNHCSLTFWMANDMKTFKKLHEGEDIQGMSHFGKITHIKDLPSYNDLKACIKEAMALLDNGWVLKRNKSTVQKEIEVPEILLKALNKNKEAKTHFDNASYSWKKEYIDWINDAKTDVTKDKRTNTAIEWMQEGKSRNWKYEK